MGLWRLGFKTGEFGFAGGLWAIWGRITDEFTHANGEPDQVPYWREKQRLSFAKR